MLREIARRESERIRMWYSEINQMYGYLAVVRWVAEQEHEWIKGFGVQIRSLGQRVGIFIRVNTWKGRVLEKS